VALQDVERGIGLFDKVNVEILGVVENMSYYLCPHCSARHEIFGHGGGREAAARLDLPFLGELPLDPAIGRGGDQGRPVVVAATDSEAADRFRQIAEGLLAELRRAADPA
jgi:ATP-binding protein involved in chromosome partitioning